MNRTKKGQAAITDALFFLLIIVTLSVLMFRYSSTYGSRINAAANDLYFKEYTNSVLRTTFYTSVPLDFDLNIHSAKETDYLMTQIKQDFYADGNIGYGDLNSLTNTNVRDIAKYNLFHTIKATMFPLKSHDYTFYLYHQERNKFNYFMIKLTNFNRNTTAQTTSPGEVVYTISGESYFLCEPEGYEQVREVVSISPKIFSSSIPLNFKQYTPRQQDQGNILMIATFAIWPATVDINSETIAQMNCKGIDFSN